MKRQSQLGFAIADLVIVVVIAAAIVTTGIFVWHEHNKSTSPSPITTASSSYQSPTTSTPTAPQINNPSDLNNAMTALNQTSISSSNVDSSQLSTYSSGF